MTVRLVSIECDVFFTVLACPSLQACLLLIPSEKERVSTTVILREPEVLGLFAGVNEIRTCGIMV